MILQCRLSAAIKITARCFRLVLLVVSFYFSFCSVAEKRERKFMVILGRHLIIASQSPDRCVSLSLFISFWSRGWDETEITRGFEFIAVFWLTLGRMGTFNGRKIKSEWIKIHFESLRSKRVTLMRRFSCLSCWDFKLKDCISELSCWLYFRMSNMSWKQFLNVTCLNAFLPASTVMDFHSPAPLCV